MENMDWSKVPSEKQKRLEVMHESRPDPFMYSRQIKPNSMMMMINFHVNEETVFDFSNAILILVIPWWCFARFGNICVIPKMWNTPMEECYF